MRSWLPLLLLVPVLGCQGADGADGVDAEGVGQEAAVDDDSADLTQGGASANSTFFLARRDMRKCAYPMCGGYWVRRVNRATTTCPVGGQAAECYVPELNLSKTGLDDEEQQQLAGDFGQGVALVRANLGKKKINGAYYGTFNASEGWLARGPSEPTGVFYRVTLNGVRCAASPCPAFDEAKLNSSVQGSLAGLDLGASGADEAALSAGQEALPAGLLVAGTHSTVTGPAGKMNALTASQFYTRVVHQEKTCDTDKTAVGHWAEGAGADAVVVQVASEQEGMSYVDPEGRSVRWVARESETATEVAYVAGVNDLWAERFTVARASCALTVTGEH